MLGVLGNLKNYINSNVMVICYEQINDTESISLRSNDMDFIKKQQLFLGSSPQIEIPSYYDKSIGVYKKNNFITDELCDKLLEQIKKDFKEKTFMKMNYGKNREEIIINLNTNDCPQLYIETYNIIKSQIKNFKHVNCMTGLVNYPGSQYQPIHTDFNYDKAQCIFIALHDTTKEMGPTLFIPSTNNNESKNNFLENNKQISKPFHEAVLKKGEAVVMDVNLLHCGTPNISCENRWLLLLTYTIE